MKDLDSLWARANRHFLVALEHQKSLRASLPEKPSIEQFDAFCQQWERCARWDAIREFLCSLSFGWTTRENRSYFLERMHSKDNQLYYSNTGGRPETGVHPFFHL